MRVSVVVPVYNAAKYLPALVDSVVKQSYGDWELVLVDDGSTDGSGMLCDEIAAKDNRIAVFHTPNRGVTAARNYGAGQAQGEWICFADADDTMPVGALQAMVDKCDGCDIVIGNKQIVNGNDVKDEIMNAVDECIDTRDFLSGLIMNRISQYITGRMFRRSLFDGGTINIPRELIMAEDFIMNVQLGNKAHRVALIADVVYGYHVYDESVSHTFRTSLAYEAMFCGCLEQALKQGRHADDLKDAMAFQKVRALKAAFMSQKGNIDLANRFVSETRREAKTIQLTRGWKLFMMLMPLKRLGYTIFKQIDK